MIEAGIGWSWDPLGQNVEQFMERFAELVRWASFPVNDVFTNHMWLRERLQKIINAKWHLNTINKVMFYLK